MSTDWSFLPALISAASGLGGVWLGGRLTWKRDAKREAERIKKESNYLAILVCAHLERLANGCWHVALDDGTNEGRPAGHGGEYYVQTVRDPTFDPLGLDVDWKVLPAELMYGILNLPYRLEQLVNQVDEVWRIADPPEYTEYFWARQHGFAKFGLEVAILSAKLRAHAHLPMVQPKDGEWSRDISLRKQMRKIEDEKKAWEARVAASPLPPPPFSSS